MKHFEKIALSKLLSSTAAKTGLGAAGAGAGLGALGYALPTSDKQEEMADNPNLINALALGGLGVGGVLGGSGGRALANKLIPSMKIKKIPSEITGGMKTVGTENGKLNAIAKLLGTIGGAGMGGVGGAYAGGVGGVLSDEKLLEEIKRKSKERSSMALT